MYISKNHLNHRGIIAIIWVSVLLLPASGKTSETLDQQLLDGQSVIHLLQPQNREGKGYKLIYLVDAPLEIFWKFKTDFDNEFLLSNEMIDSHRLVSQDGNVVVTENGYVNKPGAIFRWQTTVLPDQHLLKFILLNPEECGQKYHSGYIQLERLEQKTKVIQVAYFDFFGASFWVKYPYYGGMNHFLKYTAKWEQQTILDLKDRYH